MWGCSSRATVRASRTKRTASDGDGVSPRSTTFTATSRRGRCSRARNTAANPPSPSRSPTVNSSPRACCRRWRNVEISRDMTDAKPRKAGAAALGTAALALAWLLGVWPPPVWWRNHWPRETAMMREAQRGTDGTEERSNAPSFHPTALKDVSPLLQRMVIIGEDSRFRTHHGIDPAEIADALGADRGGGRGGLMGPRAAARREHDHATAREEPVPLVVAQSAAQAEGGGDRVAPRARAAQRPDPRTLSRDRGMGSERVGRGRGEPRLLWRAPVPAGRDASGGARRDAPTSPHVDAGVTARAHGRATRPDSRPLLRGGRVHPAGRGRTGFATGRAAGDRATGRLAERAGSHAG